MRPRLSTFLILIPLIVLVDQITKLLVQAVFRPGQVVEIIPGFFNLVFWTNDGVAFGLLSGGGSWKNFLLLVLSILVTVSIAVIYFKQKPCRTTSIGLLMVIGGAAGNLVDRLFFGRVVDFLDFHCRGYHWPAFNVADSCITIGVILVIAAGVFDAKRKRYHAPNPD